MPFGTWPWRSHAALPSSLWVRSKGLRPTFKRRGIACPHVMGEVSEFASCLEPLWEDTPEKRPRDPEWDLFAQRFLGASVPSDGLGQVWAPVGQVFLGLRRPSPWRRARAGPSKVQAQPLGLQVGQCRVFPTGQSQQLSTVCVQSPSGVCASSPLASVRTPRHIMLAYASACASLTVQGAPSCHSPSSRLLILPNLRLPSDTPPGPVLYTRLVPGRPRGHRGTVVSWGPRYLCFLAEGGWKEELWEPSWGRQAARRVRTGGTFVPAEAKSEPGKGKESLLQRSWRW